MTYDDIDTAAIRAHYEIAADGAAHDNPAGIIDIALLCDALDAARAERDRQKQNTMEALAESDEFSKELDLVVAQMEKAMARESEAVKRAEKAEQDARNAIRERDAAHIEVAKLLAERDLR